MEWKPTRSRCLATGPRSRRTANPPSMMRKFFGLVVSLTIALSAVVHGAENRSGEKIRVLVVTGGHGFEKEAFFKLFKDNPDITFQAVEHPNAYSSLTAEAATNWDVLVLYDMQQDIPDEAKKNFVA